MYLHLEHPNSVLIGRVCFVGRPTGVFSSFERFYYSTSSVLARRRETQDLWFRALSGTSSLPWFGRVARAATIFRVSTLGTSRGCIFRRHRLFLCRWRFSFLLDYLLRRFRLHHRLTFIVLILRSRRAASRTLRGFFRLLSRRRNASRDSWRIRIAPAAPSRRPSTF